MCARRRAGEEKSSIQSERAVCTVSLAGADCHCRLCKCNCCFFFPLDYGAVIWGGGGLGRRMEGGEKISIHSEGEVSTDRLPHLAELTVIVGF